MFIDFSSKPPVPEFSDGAHMANYDKVFANTKVQKADYEKELREYLSEYDRLGARHVVLKARDLSSSYGYKVSNEDVAAFCKRHGERFIPFASVDPTKGMSAIRELEHAVRQLGMRGLNLPCFEMKIAINDPRLYPLYAKCIELNIPITLHTGVNFSATSPIKGSHPVLLDEVLVHFPELRVLVGPPGWPWLNEMIAIAWRHKNVYLGLMAFRPKYLNVPGSGYEPLMTHGSSTLKDRIIFGSAFPLMTVDRAISDIEGLNLDPEIKRRWLHDNAATFLGLNLK
jgi:Predicted metal-dependent hydrolase of the TIM-barrel fold